MHRTATTWIIVAPAILLSYGKPSAPAERVQLTMATLHAAALTTPRDARDNTDAPFFVVQVVGPKASSASILPDTGSRSLRLNEAIGARSLTELSLAAGDSVQVLVSVLESVKLPSEAQVKAAPAKARAESASEQVDQANRIAAPLVKDGANWLGTVSLLLTNEGGAIFWRRLDCVASCKVLSGPALAPLASGAAQPAAGVVELSGNGGTYHLALRANHAL